MIVTTWDECKEITNHHMAVFKSFKSEYEATKYLKELTEMDIQYKDSIRKIAIEKRKNERKKGKTYRVTLDNDFSRKFENKAERLGYSTNEIILNLIKEWCDY